MTFENMSGMQLGPIFLSLAIMFGCGKSADKAEDENCNMVPESCPAPNLCVQDSVGAYVCIVPVADSTAGQTDAQLSDGGVLDCRTDGVGCTAPQACVNLGDGLFGCQVAENANDAGIRDPELTDAQTGADQGADGRRLLDCWRGGGTELVPLRRAGQRRTRRRGVSGTRDMRASSPSSSSSAGPAAAWAFR